jgi:glycosyltransferase involved in cell wall biosynthesis
VKILFVTPYFVPAWSYGGPVKVVFELARNLQRKGHEVTVVTTDVFDKHARHPERSAEIDGIQVRYFPNVSNTLAFRFNAYLPRGFARWCEQHLREFDVIHCHDFYTALNVTVARLAPQYGVPYIVQPHGALNPDRRKAKFSFIKKIFLRAFKNVLLSAASIIASTDFEKEESIGSAVPSCREKTLVIPNGLDVSQLSTPHKGMEVHRKLGIGKNEKMLIYFGRIQYIKGIDITLRALALVDLPFKFLILGRDDGMLPKLKNLVNTLGLTDRVIFHEPTFGQAMKDILSSADLFLFNSRSEALPMTVLDAAAAGLPSILSPYCHVPEVATYGAGIVLEENSPKATASAIKQYFSSTIEPGETQERCHRMIVEKFNLEPITARFLHLYSDLRPAHHGQ